MEDQLELTYGAYLRGRPATRRHILNARRFRYEHIEPVALDLDKRMLVDPHYHPHDIVVKGCDYGLLSLPIPRFLGGQGGTILDCAAVLEELCAGCAGIGNIFGAHYLGMSGVLMALDFNLYDRYFKDVVDGEGEGRPVLFSAAVTEPMAGTDVEEAEFLPRAKLVTSAKKVPGGYLLNGTKVFISNGSVARYNTVICAIDKARPLETWSAFIVPHDSPGFSASRVEDKLGQRACHAAELTFVDCFVPEQDMVGAEGRAMGMTEAVLGASRPPVGAIATGIARGAYERTLAYCRTQRAGGGYLIEREWVRQALADMYGQIQLSRSAYLHAADMFDRWLLAAAYRPQRLVEPFLRATQALRRSKSGLRFTARPAFKGMTLGFMEKRAMTHRTELLGLSSLAKFSCADAAVRVTLKAMEVLGPAAADERYGTEKSLRDAKLTQIYEGTNQLNRYMVYKNLIEEPAHA